MLKVRLIFCCFLLLHLSRPVIRRKLVLPLTAHLHGDGRRRGGGETLTASLVFQETVPPDDLLAAEDTLVRSQASVSLDMFGQVVLHFEALGAHRTGERTEIQVLHLDVAVAHALQRVGFTAVAVVNFARVGRPRERRRGGSERRRGRGRNGGGLRHRRDGLGPREIGGSRHKLVGGHREQRTLGNLPRGLLNLIVCLELPIGESAHVYSVFVG